MCQKMNVYLAGVDNIEKVLNKLNLGFGIYRKSFILPETTASLYIKKGFSSYQATCQETGNNIFLNNNRNNINNVNILVRYFCSCTFLITSISNNFNADFDSIKFK